MKIQQRRGNLLEKSKDRKKSSTASSAAGKPSDLPSNMPATGYNVTSTSDAPVIPVSQPVFTSPSHQPSTVSSMPAGSSVSIASAPATGSVSTGVDQFVSPDQGSVMSEDDTLQAQSDKESEEGQISDAEVQEKMRK